MKSFTMVALLVALLITAWLVVQSLQTSTGKDQAGKAALATVDRAAEARRQAEAAQDAMAKRLERSGKE